MKNQQKQKKGEIREQIQEFSPNILIHSVCSAVVFGSILDALCTDMIWIAAACTRWDNAQQCKFRGTVCWAISADALT